MITLPKSIRDNLQFLYAEVDAQFASLQQFFKQPSAALSRRIHDRSGYAYNLKSRIHNSCINQLSNKKASLERKQSLRTAEAVATDLDRLTELTRDALKQMDYVENWSLMQPEAYQKLVKHLRMGVSQIEPALAEQNSQQALVLGQLNQKIQGLVSKLIKDYTKTLKAKAHTEEMVSALFVAHSFSQMGDTLLHVSESIISANLGQSVNLSRFNSLQALMAGIADDEQGVQIEPIAETRSGSAISGISSDSSNGYLAIFKDGQKQKVKEERAGVNAWHDIYPGLAPKILAYKKRGESAALLIEHLPGHTFEHILLNESSELLQQTLNQLGKTLKSVWQQTHTGQPVCAQFIAQLQKRLPDVYKIHPEFAQGQSQIGELNVPSFEQLLAQAQQKEATLPAPFSVYIHGDFNLDNIIYDPLEKRINFIDLHRSSYMDYVQDVSVFMVSNYRLQILDTPMRKRILGLALDFYRIARRYALKQQDDSFEMRLALGLVRSFASSTRFILDKSLARRMWLRARYLLELVLAVPPAKTAQFRIPLKEIFGE